MKPLVLEQIVATLKAGDEVKQKFADGGRLHIERPLPFLYVYLAHEDDQSAIGRLLMGESSVLVVPSKKQQTTRYTTLLEAVVKELSAWWGAVLVLQLRTTQGHGAEPLASDEEEHQDNIAELRESPSAPAPCFTLSVPPKDHQSPLVSQLCVDLKTLTWMGASAEAELIPQKRLSLLGWRAKDARQWGGLFIDMRIEHPYIEAASAVAAGHDLRPFMRKWARILRQTCFKFSRTETKMQPPHFLALGKRVMTAKARQVDAQLASINRQFDFLLYLTPINAAAAWAEFRRNQYEREPVFLYRPLEVAPHMLKRSLHDVRLEHVSDPTIAHLLREKQDQIDRQLTALLDRNTKRFLYGSVQLYGDIPDELYENALRLLSLIPPRSRGGSAKDTIKPDTFADLAREEISHYRAQWSSFQAQVYVRPDVAGILVSQGDLLLGTNYHVPRSRIEPLLHHEVGTHCLTTANGGIQPLSLLAHGLAGYEGLQEGTAVLAEYLCGGLRKPRLRLLAGRVVAARAVLQGSSFMETYSLIHHTHQFPRREAFNMVMRVHRGGGFVKDKVYLEGFLRLLQYLKNNGDITPLWMGKIGQKHIPLVRELLWREVLQPPPLTPRYMEQPLAQERLQELRQGIDLKTLIKRIKAPTP